MITWWPSSNWGPQRHASLRTSRKKKPSVIHWSATVWVGQKGQRGHFMSGVTLRWFSDDEIRQFFIHSKTFYYPSYCFQNWKVVSAVLYKTNLEQIQRITIVFVDAVISLTMWRCEEDIVQIGGKASIQKKLFDWTDSTTFTECRLTRTRSMKCHAWMGVMYVRVHSTSKLSLQGSKLSLR